MWILSFKLLSNLIPENNMQKILRTTYTLRTVKKLTNIVHLILKMSSGVLGDSEKLRHRNINQQFLYGSLLFWFCIFYDHVFSKIPHCQPLPSKIPSAWLHNLPTQQKPSDRNSCHPWNTKCICNCLSSSLSQLIKCLTSYFRQTVWSLSPFFSFLLRIPSILSFSYIINLILFTKFTAKRLPKCSNITQTK